MTVPHWLWLNWDDIWAFLSIPVTLAFLTSPFWIYGIVKWLLS